MKKIILFTIALVAGFYIGAIASMYAITSELVFKPAQVILADDVQPYAEDYLTAPFDNDGQFKNGWQGEENSPQLQSARGL